VERTLEHASVASCPASSKLSPRAKGEVMMYWRIALALFVLWIVGVGVFGLAHPAVHVILVLAVVMFAWYIRVGDGNPI
jgi:hypothetical protein